MISFLGMGMIGRHFHGGTLIPKPQSKVKDKNDAGLGGARNFRLPGSVFGDD
jgi:hypothetical protein